MRIITNAVIVLNELCMFGEGPAKNQVIERLKTELTINAKSKALSIGKSISELLR